MIDLNKHFTSLYRYLAVGFLVIILLIAAGYAGLVSFYAGSTSWAAPLVLAPTQERVLTFQPQVANLEATIDKQRMDIQTALQTKILADEQIIELTKLVERLDGAITAEVKLQGSVSERAAALAKAKRIDIARSQAAANSARKLYAQIDQELAAKLITSDQAAQRRISLAGAMNAVTDSSISMSQLEIQAQVNAAGSETLSGAGSTSLLAMGAARQSIDIRATIAQLKLQSATAAATADSLRGALVGNERVLAVAKASPYYRALREEVTVAFVPYGNLEGMEVGDKVYDCYLQIILCRRVGKVVAVYDAEEHTKHPLFKTDLRGKLVEIKFTDEDSSKSQVVFIGGKPLML